MASTDGCCSPASSGFGTTPPSLYLSSHYSHNTSILKVDPSTISFTISKSPLHPYDNPVLHIHDSDAKQTLENAAGVLRDSKCVAFPTETVYGLGANALSSEGVRCIFSAKQRPLDNPLIVHVSSLKQLRQLMPSDFAASKLPKFPDGNGNGTMAECEEGEIPEIYAPLIQKFWPGPLTILLPLSSRSPLSPHVTAGQPTFAARIPEHPIALALCELSGLPLAAPSANASGRPSPTTAAHVDTDLNGRIPLILDGGCCAVGLESTVVDGLRYPPVILRPGGISAEQIKECGGSWRDVIVGQPNVDDEKAAPQAPGMKYKHYSPRAGVVLYEVGARAPNGKELVRSVRGRGKVGILRTRTWKEGMGRCIQDVGKSGDESSGDEGFEWNAEGTEVIERSLGKDGRDISRMLFSGLRDLDNEGVDTIHVEGIDESAEGLAVMNRLRKAASVVVRKV
ncbi:hypothetical protein RUND412_002454 [Rhizina undulata]